MWLPSFILPGGFGLPCGGNRRRHDRLVFLAARLTEYPNAFPDKALGFQESQQVGVDGIGLGRGHAVRKAPVGFQCAILY
jgi:hypothetical protein